MVSLVEQMLCLHESFSGGLRTIPRLLRHQIDATDAEIDRLVYDLYGLTEEEIAVVEKARGS